MCTAISVTVKDNYFGRNLDYEYSFGEKVAITPKNYVFKFGNGEEILNHSSIIGMALPVNNYPLYFDATNEEGLSMAGLNFPDNARYNEYKDEMENIASYELIPWVLCKCKTVADAEKLLKNTNITDEAFKDDMKPSPLHWIIADKDESITVEQTESGMMIYKNPVGILTNNPTFDMQMLNLSNYMSVSADEPENMFSDKVSLKTYSRGMGGIGLPGDLSSVSRFVRATFTKLNSVYGDTEEEVVSQFFHILYSVYQQRGCVKVGEDFEITHYSSCCNTSKGVYYYTTYNNSRVYGVDMHREDLSGQELIVYPLKKKEELYIQN